MERELAQYAKAAILVNLTTGIKLFSKNENTRLDIASITKLMTIFIILNKIRNQELQWGRMIQVNEQAVRLVGSKVPLQAGYSYSVEDLFKGILICSGNDAAYTIAEYINGSEEAFVKEMNQKAIHLNLLNTHFMNPHGLPQNNHYSTVQDLVTLTIELLKEKTVLDFSNRKSDSITVNSQTRRILNTNTLLKKCNKVDGLKTGYSPRAGHCIVATASINEVRFLAIVLGEPTREIRDQEVLELLHNGNLHYENGY